MHGADPVGWARGELVQLVGQSALDQGRRNRGAARGPGGPQYMERSEVKDAFLSYGSLPFSCINFTVLPYTGGQCGRYT